MAVAGTYTVTVSYTEGEKTATATYQITVVESQNLPEGIASIKSKAISTTDTEFAVVLTDAVVTYVSGSNAYIEDAEAGILIYKSGHGLKAGDKLNGEVSGKVKLYSNLREITDIDYSQATMTEGAEVPVTEVTLAELNGAYDKYENMRIKIVDAHVSAEKQISQGEDQTYALYFKGQSLTGFDVYNIIDVIGYPTKYNSNIQLNVWENAVVKGATKTTITGISDVTVKVGETKAINAKASSGAKVSYVSANPSVATVDEDGNVTGVAEGESTITVSVPAYNGYPAAEEVCNVTVSAAAEGGGDEKVPATTACYVLDGTKTGGSNGYATESSIEQNAIKWGVVGNTTQSPWRIGGKSLTKTDRNVYTKTAYSSELSKIEFISGTLNVTSWNSLTLVYSTNSDFSNSQTMVVSSVGANKTIEFLPEGGFPANCYYKFILNITVNGDSNKYVQLKEIKFYGYEN